MFINVVSKMSNKFIWKPVLVQLVYRWRYVASAISNEGICPCVRNQPAL